LISLRATRENRHKQAQPDGCARSEYELRTIRQSSPGRLLWFKSQAER